MEKGVIWDLDGVLADTADFHYRSWRQALPKFNLDLSEEQFQRTFGMNNTDIIKDLLGETPTREFVLEVSDEKDQFYRRILRGRVEALPGVREWLKRLQARGFRQAIASSAPMENIDAVVNELELRGYFDAIVSAFDLPGKPDPAVFLEAAHRIAVPPQECIVIEDSLAGVEAAKRAGMKRLAVTTTNPAEALAQADLVVERLNLLPPDAFELLLAS